MQRKDERSAMVVQLLNISNSMIDRLAALDQAESRFRSENIKFGIRHRMRSGKTVLNHTQFLGYTKGPDGILQIVPEEAEVVRKIFELYIQGNGVRKIKQYLEKHGIKTVTGKAEWSTSTIDRLYSEQSKLETGCGVFGCCIRHSYFQLPRLRTAHC